MSRWSPANATKPINNQPTPNSLTIQEQLEGMAEGEEKDFAFARIPQCYITVRKHLLDGAERFDMQSELAPCGVKWKGKLAVNSTAKEIAHILETAKNFKLT